MATAANPEDILLETGGCGLYQIVLCILAHSIKVVTVWSITTMIFASKTPLWWCTDDLQESNLTVQEFQTLNNVSLSKSCTSFNGSKCSTFLFDGDLRTVVTEWDLVCDRAWVPATLMSIQMAGVFLGHLCAGHVADAIGRKKPFFYANFLMLIFNVGSVFSVSWPMFAVFRFLIGFGIGCFITVQYTLMCEFSLSKWRPLIVGLPSWGIESCLFALGAWLLRDWKYIHIAIAVLAGLTLTAWWFFPESFRWYLAHNRVKDAEKVILKVAKFNRKPAPDLSVLHQLAEEGNDRELKAADKRQYSMLDLVRSRRMLRITALLSIEWFTLGFVTYGIKFGIQALSGNVFLNIFLFSIIAMPAGFLSIYLMNRLGRKVNAVICYGTCALGATIVGIVQNLETDMKDQLTNGFALFANLGISAAWGATQTMTTELYPTVVRNIGYGTLNLWARIGAIIGPQFVFIDSRVPGTMYFVCCALCLCSVVAILILPETRNVPLNDNLESISMGDKTTEINKAAN